MIYLQTFPILYQFICCMRIVWFILKRAQSYIKLFVVFSKLFVVFSKRFQHFKLFVVFKRLSPPMLYSSGCHRPSSDWKAVRISLRCWIYIYIYIWFSYSTFFACLPFFVLYCPEQRIKLWRASRNITWNRPELVPGEPGTNSRRFHVMRVLMYPHSYRRTPGGGMIITHPNNPLYRERRRRCQSWDLRRLSRETPPHSYRRTPAFLPVRRTSG